MALYGISTLLVAANAGVVWVSLITYVMSEDGAIPRIFSRLHKKYSTPFVSIIVFSSIAAGIAFSGRLDVAAELYNFGALIAYVIVGLSLISLRNKEKNLVRPFKTPCGIKMKRAQNKDGKEHLRAVPIIALGCVVVDLIICLLVVFLHPLGRSVGSLWMGLGFLLFFIYTRVREEKGNAQATSSS